MIETLKRCSICKSEKCDGREFRVHGNYYRDDIEIDMIVCSSQVKKKRDGTYRYRLIFGHGEWVDAPAIPVQEGIAMSSPSMPSISIQSDDYDISLSVSPSEPEDEC